MNVTPDKPLVLVGLMGAGKSTIGRRLATCIDLPFVDTDQAIESREHMAISTIFAEKGEAYFRDAEARALADLLQDTPQVIATGGGLFMRPENRGLIKQYALSIWLKADIDTLLDRVSRRRNRPLLEGRDKREVLQELMEIRHPVYAEADITIDSSIEPHELVVEHIIRTIAPLFSTHTNQQTAS